MPTSNKRLPIDYEASEYEQIKAIAETLDLSVTQFIRLAVREKITTLGYAPSNYQYQSGRKKAQG